MSSASHAARIATDQVEQVELTTSALEALALGAPSAPGEEMGSYVGDRSSMASTELPGDALKTTPHQPSYADEPPQLGPPMDAPSKPTSTAASTTRKQDTTSGEAGTGLSQASHDVD